jgi:hypothetical protein
MTIAMSNALALVRGNGLGGFFGDFRHGDLIWLGIGAVLLIVVVWALSRRKRRWGLKF